MHPPLPPGPPTGRIQPSCTSARGRAETLMRGRDSGTRYGPVPTTKATMGDAARPTTKLHAAADPRSVER